MVFRFGRGRSSSTFLASGGRGSRPASCACPAGLYGSGRGCGEGCASRTAALRLIGPVAGRIVRPTPARGGTGVGNCGQATKGAGWMSWHREATKDVVACDKLREAGKRALIRRFLNEETQRHDLPLPATEFIGCGGERGELKHLSTRRKRKRHRFRQ
jgi:hypothetical protein